MTTLSKILASKTITLWHGGNLDVVKDEHNHKGGRWEYGPGLYLTARWDIAQKYAKGGRKLYRVTIEEGTEIQEVSLLREKTDEFVRAWVPKSKHKALFERMEKFTKGDKIKANIFMNLFINEKYLKDSDSDRLRAFLVENGVDYQLEKSAFGFHSTLLVLFNMAKIVKKEHVTPKDKIEVFDLPNEFS